MFLSFLGEVLFRLLFWIFAWLVAARHEMGESFVSISRPLFLFPGMSCITSNWLELFPIYVELHNFGVLFFFWAIICLDKLLRPLCGGYNGSPRIDAKHMWAVDPWKKFRLRVRIKSEVKTLVFVAILGKMPCQHIFMFARRYNQVILRIILGKH